MFSASKQCHSSSTSGPSTIAKPMRVKISSMLVAHDASADGDGRARGARPGSVTSTAPAGRAASRAAASYARPARFDRLLQLVGVAGRCASSGRAARVADHLHPRRRRRCSCGRDTGRGPPARRAAVVACASSARTRAICACDGSLIGKRHGRSSCITKTRRQHEDSRHRTLSRRCSVRSAISRGFVATRLAARGGADAASCAAALACCGERGERRRAARSRAPTGSCDRA